MDIKSIFLLICLLLCYYPASYFLLRSVGVNHQLPKRALVFGATIGGLQFILPVALLFISYDYGVSIGGILGFVLSYLYVAKVINIKWYKNLAVVIFLPMMSGIVAAPVMLVLFEIGL